MGRFETQIATAKRLIQLNGKLVDWVKLSTPNNEDNDDDPWETLTSDIPATTPVTIAFFPNTASNRRIFQLLPDTDIPTSSQLGYMAAQAFEPHISDRIYFTPGDASTTKAIEAIETIAPNGEAILHIIYFKD